MALTDSYVLWAWVLLLMFTATGLYVYRSRWLPFISNMIPEQAYHRLNPSFESDMEAGLSSDDFNLSGNLAAGDSRGGLDLASKKEVLRIMKGQRVNFDEARQIFMEQKLLKNGIAADGRPMDPRAVFFS
ncbi:hypothetical protein B9Z19DRAFT_1123413 [Tuber borchii]|uniref:Uncharacterized protein n=1 Tax=Tuber borchii TaxID=42251 RepID=A0A2T6ZYJ5_TUBBO|nr:hypothetical protein B9Z19DRAFT_1123413 [Tuber borchii]